MLQTPSAYVAYLANDNATPSAAERFAIDIERLRRRAAVSAGKVDIYGHVYAYALQMDGSYTIKGHGTEAVALPLPSGAGFSARVTEGRQIRNLALLTLVVSESGLRVKR